MEVKVEVGDVVRLKSGGPMMTVRGVKDSVIDCVWFDTDNNYHVNKFNIRTLVSE